MSTITRNRVLRPSTRQESSLNYKIDTKKVGIGDTLIVNIAYEESPSDILFSFKFHGIDISDRDSIHFEAIQGSEGWEIRWLTDVRPISLIP